MENKLKLLDLWRFGCAHQIDVGSVIQRVDVVSYARMSLST
jgi:hypothetical protein